MTSLLEHTRGKEGAAADPAVPILLESPTDVGGVQPLTFGVPFPRGGLQTAAGLVLAGANGQELPLETHVLARWTDNTIRWLLVSTLLDPARHASHRLWLRPDAVRPGPASDPFHVEEQESAFVIRTGPYQFRIDHRELRPLVMASFAGAPILAAAGSELVFLDAKGRHRRIPLEHATVESRGPVRLVVRLSGRVRGAGGARTALAVLCRLTFFAGLGLVHAGFCLHNPRRAKHPGGLWDLGDPGSALFRELALELCFVGGETHLRTEPERERTRLGGPWTLYQDSSGGERWDYRTHVDRNGRVPCRIQGYRLTGAGREESGRRASPVVVWNHPKGSVAVAIPRFWQEFPKALSVEDSRLRLGLFPAQWNGPFELQAGERKRHEVWIDFGVDPSAGSALAWVHAPVAARPDPEWIRASDAIDYFALPGDESPWRRFAEPLFDSAAGFLARRETIDEYGWRNFGEVHADHEDQHFPGPHPVVSHYNNQYDPILGFLCRWLVSGGDAGALGEDLARHVADIDIYHTRLDKAAYNGGLFWHTDHYKDAGTATHRTYSRVNAGAAGTSYGGGPSPMHAFTSGLLLHHYLTGDPFSREAVLELADWLRAADDGSLSLLGILDDGPSGGCTMTAQADYHGPGRGAGNALNAMIDAWLLTERLLYLHKADEIVRRVIHPADDLTALRLDEPELRWSYTVFLVSLDKYLRARVEAGLVDDRYAYGQAALLHYARWMTANETPYLDHPEKLEYITEAWPAQDLRKANVLRLAALHADGEEARAMRRKADELAARAWADLDRFGERKWSARAAAILLFEGIRDGHLRECPSRPSAPSGVDFGRPAGFVPQKERIRRLLKSPGKLLASLIRVSRWRRPLAAALRGAGALEPREPETFR